MDTPDPDHDPVEKHEIRGQQQMAKAMDNCNGKRFSEPNRTDKQERLADNSRTPSPRPPLAPYNGTTSRARA